MDNNETVEMNISRMNNKDYDSDEKIKGRPKIKGRLILGEKSYEIFKTMYLLGGKATSKQIYSAMYINIKEKHNLQTTEHLRWSIMFRPYYITKTDEKGEKYMNHFGGKYTKVYQLKKRVMDYFERELQNADTE